MMDEAIERINQRTRDALDDSFVYAKPNRAGRRRGRKPRPRSHRGVAISDKPWQALSFPQCYDIDKRGNVRGQA